MDNLWIPLLEMEDSFIMELKVRNAHDSSYHLRYRKFPVTDVAVSFLLHARVCVCVCVCYFTVKARR